MRVLALLACLAALLVPALSGKVGLEAAVDMVVPDLVHDPNAIDLVPDSELPELEMRAAVDKATESCLTELGGLHKLLGVDARVPDSGLILPWGRWYLMHCGHHWCWCRCYFWWCPWHWLHRQGFHEEARQVLACTARANNVVSEEQDLNVEALEKSLLEKLTNLNDTTKNSLGLDEKPVPRE